MNRREALITGVVLAATSLLITVLVVTGSGAGSSIPLVTGPVGGAGVETPDDPDPDEPDPDSGDDPSPSTALGAFVAEAIAFVEAARGQQFLSTPDVVVLDEAAFVARVDADLTEDFESDPDQVEIANAVYRATGLIGAAERIDEVYRQFGAAGILGFYDPETDELVVRQVDELSLLTKSTIVHELTHAYDDQLFDLDRPEYDDRTDEVPWTFRAVAEGSASWVETQWKAMLSRAEQGELLEEELSFGDASAFDGFELAFLLFELSPYQHGEPFIDHLVEGGGAAAVDDALTEPPATSEQVIRPSRYDTNELAFQIDAPLADGEVLFEGVGGQALIEALFQGNGVFRTVEWGGDQMAVWVNETESCLRWDVQSETSDGLVELRAGFDEWGDRVGSTTVAAVDAVTIRIDRCV